MITLEKKLEQMVSETISWMGFTLWGIQFYPQQSLLRVYIDKEAGITVDDCVSVSRQVEAILDVKDPIGQEYVLEVSSPGLDRPLLKLDHWEQSIGERVRVHLLTPQDGRMKFKGVLLEVKEDCAVLDTGQDEARRLPLDCIKRAHIIPSP